MSYVVENMTRRPVSIVCNSGKAYHLPPRFKLEVPEVEITNNDMLAKLQSRHVLSVNHSGDPAKPPSSSGPEAKRKAKETRGDKEK